MCHAHFADERAFAYHQTVEACLVPSGLMRRDGRARLQVRDRGFGPVWSVVDYRDRERPYAT